MTFALNFPALHASHAGIWISDSGGKIDRISKGEAVGRASEAPRIMLHAPMVAQRLGYADLAGLDLLELFAFVFPARFMVPTPKGLAAALGIDDTEISASDAISDEAVPRLLHAAAQKLLGVLADSSWPEREGAWDSAQSLMRLRWPWANLVLARLKKPASAERLLFSRLPIAHFRPAARHRRQLLLDQFIAQGDRFRRGARGCVLPFGQPRK